MMIILNCLIGTSVSEGLLTIIPANSHEEASSILVATLIDSITSTNDKQSLGLAGGSTPQLTYMMLREYSKVISGLQLWLTDERWVDSNNKESNSRMIKESFNSEKIDLLLPEYSGKNPSIDANNYTTKLLSSIKNFTHGILGIGEDGHTASLFPNSNALEENRIGIVATRVSVEPYIRLTATFELLSKIDNLYLLATGTNKKDIVNKVIKEIEESPITKLISMRNETIIITDQI